MRFETAVKATPELAEAYHRGIQALESADRKRLIYSDGDRLAGSVYLEQVLNIPNEPVWDYGIGWKLNESADTAIWIEVHPASSSHVSDIINKVKWLKRWLDERAPQLKRITRSDGGFVWISSGRIALQRGSPQAHRLAQEGVAFPQRRLRL